LRAIDAKSGYTGNRLLAGAAGGSKKSNTMYTSKKVSRVAVNSLTAR
jgi:hypothetical protein